jgi:Fe-S-cluster-containing dehydrogenase component
MPRYVMVIDAAKCLNCKACILACQQRNELRYGYCRNWVRQTPSPTAATGYNFQPGSCMQCDNPSCVAACPTLATRKDPDGVVRVDARRCIGCGSCIAACPYGARYRDPVLGVADKCEYCTTSRAHGLEPACVQACATRVRLFGDADDPADPVHALLKERQLTYVAPTGTALKPTQGYLGQTSPTDWPRNAKSPTPVALMASVAGGVRWLGGLALLGILGVLVRQRVKPTEGADNGHNDRTGGPA